MGQSKDKTRHDHFLAPLCGIRGTNGDTVGAHGEPVGGHGEPLGAFGCLSGTSGRISPSRFGALDPLFLEL